jgi:hypothetical protein
MMTLYLVMAGPVPAIHVFDAARLQDVDARDTRGHEEDRESSSGTVGIIQGMVCGQAMTQWISVMWRIFNLLYRKYCHARLQEMRRFELRH